MGASRKGLPSRSATVGIYCQTASHILNERVNHVFVSRGTKQTLPIGNRFEEWQVERFLTEAIPHEARSLQFSFLLVRHDAIDVVHGGGFHHYGFLLVKDDAASTEKTNAWILSLFNDDIYTTELMRFETPIGETFPIPKYFSYPPPPHLPEED